MTSALVLKTEHINAEMTKTKHLLSIKTSCMFSPVVLFKPAAEEYEKHPGLNLQ